MVPPALNEALERLVAGQPLHRDLARDAVDAVLTEGCDPSAISAFLTALHHNGIDSTTLGGAADAVRRRMVPFVVDDASRPLLDTCGTGGDGANSVNISTAAAIIVASCGVRVAKHGNRSATGNSGSAEVLAELGVKYDAEPLVLRRCLEDLGITFLFAPRFHPALKGIAPIRKSLPFRTIFNLIGPLVNPSAPDAQVVGVPSRELALLISSVLRQAIGGGSRNRPRPIEPEGMDVSYVKSPVEPPGFRAFVVNGEDGLDEVTLAGATHGYEIRDSARAAICWQPSDFGLPITNGASLRVTGPTESAIRIREMLAGNRGPARDVTLANAAAALKLVDKVGSLAEGVALAAEAIDRGDASRLLGRWSETSHS